jgi:hypothetical protein
MEKLFDKRVMETTEMLQKFCHKFVDDIMITNPNLTHQDATNIWILSELAEIKVMLYELQKNK